MTGSYEIPVSISIIKDWQSHSYINFMKWERDLILAMDATFRQSMADVLKFHQSRQKVKQDDGGDKRRLMR